MCHSRLACTLNGPRALGVRLSKMQERTVLQVRLHLRVPDSRIAFKELLDDALDHRRHVAAKLETPHVPPERVQVVLRISRIIFPGIITCTPRHGVSSPASDASFGRVGERGVIVVSIVVLEAERVHDPAAQSRQQTVELVYNLVEDRSIVVVVVAAVRTGVVTRAPSPATPPVTSAPPRRTVSTTATAFSTTTTPSASRAPSVVKPAQRKDCGCGKLGKLHRPRRGFGVFVAHLWNDLRHGLRNDLWDGLWNDLWRSNLSERIVRKNELILVYSAGEVDVERKPLASVVCPRSYWNLIDVIALGFSVRVCCSGGSAITAAGAPKE